MESLGRQLGCYELKRILGRGASGTVYLADHRIIKSQVAVKILHPSLCTKDQVVRGFFAETRSVNLIGHPNIAKVYDLGATVEGEHFVAMEYLAGKPLERQGTLEDLQPILYQVMDALAAAHENGFAHHDLKPENIRLIAPTGRPITKVLDFGVAKLLLPGADARPEDRARATNLFSAPETILGDLSDHRADIYALGAILFWLATGRVPFEAGTFDMIAQAGSTPQAPKPSEVCPSVPTSYDAMILRALAHEPDARYQTIRDLRAGFELAIAIAQQQQKAQASQPSQPGVPGRSKPESSGRNVRLEAPRPVSTETLDLVSIHKSERWVNGATGMRAELEVQMRIRDLASFRRMYSMDIAHHGMFIGTLQTPPALQTLINVVIRKEDAADATGEIVLLGRVVRHVTATDAQSFGGEQGMAIQLLDLDQKKRTEIERMIFTGSGRYDRKDRVTEKNLKAEKLITRFAAFGVSSGPYNLLQILPGAAATAIRETAHRLIRETDPDVLGAMTDDQVDQISEIRGRLEKAGALLVDPKTRAAHDGATGNFLGVAQALADGLAPDDLANLRRQFLATRWEAAPAAQSHVREAMRSEYAGKLNEARTELERALQMDPLDLETHNLYWALRHRMENSQSMKI